MKVIHIHSGKPVKAVHNKIVSLFKKERITLKAIHSRISELENHLVPQFTGFIA